jgi:hypothetical protein
MRVWAADPAAPPRVARRHRPAVRTEDQALQERRHLRAGRSAASVCRLGHDSVRLVPGALVDDRGVLARIGNALMDRFAEIDAVGEHFVDRTFGPRLATARPSGALTALVTSPAAFSSRAMTSAEPVLAKRSKMRRTVAASLSTTTSRRFSTS